VTVELVLVDLDDRTAVVRVVDGGTPGFPHALRGTLLGMLADPKWHVIVAFDSPGYPRAEVAEVLDDAVRWAIERECYLTVSIGGVASSRWSEARDVFP
jgi:hypothetical protein